MSQDGCAALHMIDLIRKKRDGGALDAREIGFLVAGAAEGSIPMEQLAAWLMAAWLNGLTLDETRALDAGHARLGREVFSARLGKQRRRQALHRRRGRQDQLSGGAAGRGMRRGCAHDQRARAGAHRRHAG